MSFKFINTHSATYLQKSFKSLTAAVCVAAVFVGTKPNAADFYDIIDLGKFEEGIYQTEAMMINNNDVVTGFSVKEGDFDIVDSNGDIVSTTLQFFRAYSFDESQSNLLDLGAIDNREVFVETTNTVDGEIVNQSVNVGEVVTSSFGFAINEQGLVVGTSNRTFGRVISNESDGVITEVAVGTSIERAVLFEPGNSEIIELPDFIENLNLNMRALGVDGDLVVGFGGYNDPDDVDENGDPLETVVDSGFIYEISSGNLVRIPPLEGGASMSLRDINSNGIAVGVSSKFVNETGSIEVVSVDFNSNQEANEISIFGGISQQAWAVNDNGIIVGQALRENESVFTAFSYDLNTGTATDLGVLNDSFAAGAAYGINNAGQIVGTSQVQSSPILSHAFIYENGQLKDLDKLIGCDTGWRLDEARSINENGIIVGKGVFGGEVRGFMLKPKEGTAPNCEPDSDSGSGSISILSYSLFLIVAMFGRRKVRR